MKDIWSKNSLGDYVCKLGSLEKAIVIARTGFLNLKTLRTEYHWRISIRSYLPFTKAEYAEEFETAEKCAEYAESIILNWLNSLLKGNLSESLKLE